MSDDGKDYKPESPEYELQESAMPGFGEEAEEEAGRGRLVVGEERLDVRLDWRVGAI